MKPVLETFKLYPIVTPECLCFGVSTFTIAKGDVEISQDNINIANLICALSLPRINNSSIRAFDDIYWLFDKEHAIKQIANIVKNVIGTLNDDDIEVIAGTADKVNRLSQDCASRYKTAIAIMEKIKRTCNITDEANAELVFVESGDKAQYRSFAKLGRGLLALSDDACANRTIVWEKSSAPLAEIVPIIINDRQLAAKMKMLFPFSIDEDRWMNGERNRKFFDHSRELVKERWKAGIGSGNPPYDFDKKIDYDKL